MRFELVSPYPIPSLVVKATAEGITDLTVLSSIASNLSGTRGHREGFRYQQISSAVPGPYIIIVIAKHPTKVDIAISTSQEDVP